MKPEEVQQEFANLLHNGATAEITQPSGRKVLIREWNGGDEDILTQGSGATDGSSVHNFIASCIVKDLTTGRKPTVAEVESWGIKDKYYTMMKIRILTLGSKIKFYHACSSETCDFINPAGSPWSEDLNIFDWDMSKAEPPKEGEEGYIKLSPFAITKYAKGMDKQVTITLSSGKLLRYNILDSKGELLQLAIPRKQTKKSDGLIVRNLEIQIKGEWVPVKDFRLFSARDTQELWKDLADNDSGFAAMAEITCPKCGMQELINLFTEPSFFNPVGI